MVEIDDTAQLTLMLRSHVERALQEIWGSADLVTDCDHDYPFRSQTAMCWLSIVDGASPGVRVFAHAVHGVPRSVKLLAELTELNLRSRWASISWDHGIVVVDAALHWESVDRSSVERVLDAVTAVADEIGIMIATVYGGATPFPLDLETVGSDEDVA